MYINETNKSNEAGYELPLSDNQQQALTSHIKNGNFEAKQSFIAYNPCDSFQAKPAFVLSFDNPAHERRMK